MSKSNVTTTVPAATKSAIHTPRAYTKREHDFPKKTRRQIFTYAKNHGLVNAAKEFNTSYKTVRGICKEFGYEIPLGRPRFLV